MYQSLDIDEEFGSVSGYLVTHDAPNLRFFLLDWLAANEVDAVLGALASSLPCGSVAAVLKNLYVEMEHRGRGHGAHLMNEFTEQAFSADAKVMFLLAGSNEEQAPGFNLNGFYEGYDWEVVHTNPCGALMCWPPELAQVIGAAIESCGPRRDKQSHG